MDSHVSKGAVIDAISLELDMIDHVPQWVYDRLEKAIKELPSAEEESFEWCTGCKEYDQEAHCCHRWSKMIQKTVDEMQIVRCKDCKYAEYIDDVQTLWCTECGNGRTVAPYDFCSYGERRDDKVTCENCYYSEQYVDGLILCRRTRPSHRVSATSTCGKGKREKNDEQQRTWHEHGITWHGCDKQTGGDYSIEPQ